MRLVVDLRPVDDRVEGTLAEEGGAEPSPFSGWLELLRLLEARMAADTRPVTGGAA
ncbi:MAG TPA: hypothetical protein VL337_14725 [Acidimicrobiales bacterium]|jgi:hypothetical protein|nr:hypothetical protein [Acidimicrobiales bacterium]